MQEKTLNVSPSDLLKKASELFNLKQFEAAANLCRKATETPHSYTLEETILMSNIFMESGEAQKSIKLLKNILQYNLYNLDILIKTGQAYMKMYQEEEAIHWFEKAHLFDRENKQARTLLQHARTELRRKEKLPAMFLITLPKSASEYIMHAFLNGLRIERRHLSSNIHIPNDLIVMDNLRNAHDINKGQGFLAKEHLTAHPYNVYLLNRTFPRWVVHIREPRQALLSWHHYMIKARKHILPFNVPNHYYNLPFKEQLDWQIENFLPFLTQWIADWIELTDHPNFKYKILLTTFEEFVQNSSKFFHKILNFYKINPAEFTPPAPPQWGVNLYRSGKIDEWKTVFSNEQKQKASQIIPHHLKTRFNWDD